MSYLSVSIGNKYVPSNQQISFLRINISIPKLFVQIGLFWLQRLALTLIFQPGFQISDTSHWNTDPHEKMPKYFECQIGKFISNAN